MKIFTPLERCEFRDEIFSYIDNFSNFRESLFKSLPKPANVIEWATSGNFLGFSGIYDTVGQYYALREFFQCYCPICSNWKGEDIFKLDRDQLLKDKLLVFDWEKQVELCPKCGLTKKDFVEEGLLKEYNVLLGIIGMRAGKTAWAGIVMTFFEQFIINQGSARFYFDLKAVPYLEIACVAVSEKQAKRTIWAQYLTLREASLWFSEFKDIIRDYRLDKEGFYEETSQLIRNELSNLHISSLHSSSASLAGTTRLLFVIDELSRFDTTESKRSAQAVWSVGEHSLKTVRNIVRKKGLPIWLGSIIGIGSPISIDDFGMKLLEKDSDMMLKMHYATWEFNRTFTEKDFEEEAKTDPIAVKRDFGAIPPGSELPFIEDWDLFKSMVEDASLTPIVSFKDTVRYGQLANSNSVLTYLGKRIDSIRFDDSEWVIAGDAGKSRDSFALVGCKKVWDGNDFKMVQGFTLHILPDAVNHRLVDFECIVPLIKVLSEHLKIVLVCFDYWNSELIIQQLMSLNIPVEFYTMSSIKIEDFMNFKNACLLGKVRLLKCLGSEDGDPKFMDSQTRQYWELKRLQRSKDLKKIDHSPRSTSDLSECLVNCWRMINKISQDKMVNFYPKERDFGNVVRFYRW